MPYDQELTLDMMLLHYFILQDINGIITLPYLNSTIIPFEHTYISNTNSKQIVISTTIIYNTSLIVIDVH